MTKSKSFLHLIPDKQLNFKSTTSRLWKEDVYDFFRDDNINNSLEIGTNMGWTSFFLSHISEQVYTIEINPKIMDVAKETCKEKTNIKYIIGDAYSDNTYKNFPKYFDLVVIDCIHHYNQVILDINRALSFMNPDKGIYILFDDYSHPEAPEVKQAIDHSINNGLKFEKHIGHNKGHTIIRSNNTQFTLTGPEGIILSYGI